MRKKHTYIVILFLICVLSCRNDRNRQVEEVSTLIQADTLDQSKTSCQSDTIIDEENSGKIDEKQSISKIVGGTLYTQEVISVGKEGGALKRLTYTLYEIKFYPPGLKEAYETYMQRDGYAEKASTYRYHNLVIYGDVVIFKSINKLVSLGDLIDRYINCIGYVTLNGVDFRVFDASKGEYKHIIKTRKNPKTFTTEYMSYPEDTKEILDYGGAYAISGALDLENIPEVGEEINGDEEIDYVFYKDWNMLWEKRRRAEQSKAASEAKDTLGTDSVASVNPTKEAHNDEEALE